MRKLFLTFLVLSLVATACSLPGLQAAPPTPTVTPSLVDTDTPFPSPTNDPTRTPTPSRTPRPSPTITETPTPGPSPTITIDYPTLTVKMQAHCRYGPNIAYLHAADLYPGDTASVRGRFLYSGWLYVKFDKLKYFCWVAPSVVTVTGDITKLKFLEVYLPESTLYNSPRNVVAVRTNNDVTISWDMVKMTSDDDRGYFLDIYVCQKGDYIWWPVSLDSRDKVSYTVVDEKGCAAASGGDLYAVEKHGYTKPVVIEWPKPVN